MTSSRLLSPNRGGSMRARRRRLAKPLSYRSGPTAGPGWAYTGVRGHSNPLQRWVSLHRAAQLAGYEILALNESLPCVRILINDEESRVRVEVPGDSIEFSANMRFSERDADNNDIEGFFAQFNIAAKYLKFRPGARIPRITGEVHGGFKCMGMYSKDSRMAAFMVTSDEVSE